MDLVIARILDPLCSERMRAFDNAGKSAHAESLVRAYVSALPLVASAIGMDGKIFPRLAGRILALADGVLPPVLAAAKQEVSTRYIDAIARAKPSDWEFFEAGIAQSLIAEADSGSMRVALEDWIGFGLRGLAASGSPAKKKEDPQGLLFDF